ncbi:MAG: DNA internalization-related competence protein ComEC/Rec2 [Lachnospiraceae bacterium]|nr:DNA internalization-related competence protein ComEC/Rec2 [Lachnospiraceae bacterium]
MGRRPLCVCLLFFLAVYLACSQIFWTQDTGGQSDFDGQQMVLTGIVSDIYEPLDLTKDNCILYLKQIDFQEKSESFKQSELIEKTEQGAVCYLRNGQKMPHIGAAVQVWGSIYSFQAASNPGEFDAAKYYARQGYHFKVYDAVLRKESVSYDKKADALYRLRVKTARVFEQALGEKNGALASAMVTGRKKDMDAEIKTVYQYAGISHILSISGLHISMVGSMAAALLKKSRLPALAACLVSLVLVVTYGIFTGMQVSTFRAVVMFCLGMTAQIVSRTPDMLTSLVIAAAVILVKNPAHLTDTGFLLSFSAVTGMAVVVPVLKDRGIAESKASGWLQNRMQGVYDGICVTLGVTVTMFPFLAAAFYVWNPWSLLWNPAAVLVIGVLMPFLFTIAGTGILLEGSWIYAPVLKILAFPAGLCFGILEEGSRLLEKLPGSFWHIGMPKLWQICLFLTGLILLILFGKKVRPGCRIVFTLGLLCVFLVRLPGTLSVAMLDVGQGACIVVQTPEHDTYLLDAGSTSKPDTGTWQIVPYLKYQGVRQLDAIFISHWDADHVNGLEAVLDWAQREKVAVGAVVFPKTAFSDDALHELTDMVKMANIPVLYMQAGDLWQKNGITFQSLHPYEGEEISDRNEASLVLRMRYRDFAALFPGDLEGVQEEWVCENYETEKLRCRLLMLGHHGSQNASSQVFLEKLCPQAALISCGKNNPYGHPHRQVLDRLKENGIVWYTSAQNGAVRVEIKEDQMKIHKFLGEQADGYGN